MQEYIQIYYDVCISVDFRMEKSGGSLSDAGDRDHGYHAEDGAL